MQRCTISFPYSPKRKSHHTEISLFLSAREKALSLLKSSSTPLHPSQKNNNQRKKVFKQPLTAREKSAAPQQRVNRRRWRRQINDTSRAAARGWEPLFTSLSLTLACAVYIEGRRLPPPPTAAAAAAGRRRVSAGATIDRRAKKTEGERENSRELFLEREASEMRLNGGLILVVVTAAVVVVVVKAGGMRDAEDFNWRGARVRGFFGGIVRRWWWCRGCEWVKSVWREK